MAYFLYKFWDEKFQYHPLILSNTLPAAIDSVVRYDLEAYLNKILSDACSQEQAQAKSSAHLWKVLIVFLSFPGAQSLSICL